MSADNWDICPICKKKKDNLKREKYGKIPPEEYEKLIEEFKHPDYADQDETVREDYNGGPYFDNEGNWCFSGGASCEVCGTDWKIEIKAKPNLMKEED